VNARKHNTVFQALLVAAIVQAAFADSARVSTSQGNKLYMQGNFNEAINEYDQALVEAPQALQPRFNKANSYYRLDDLSKAQNRETQICERQSMT
jgi:tetratricopeptide (TPR) repeat protein